MKEQGIFISIEEAKRGLAPTADRATLKFGTREVLFKSANEVKSGRRMKTLLAGLQANGVFPKEATFGEQALLHGENGNPTFIEMQLPDQRSWFVSARPVVYDGSLMRKDKVGERLNTDEFDIVTGICLFGAHCVEADGKSGKRYQITDPAMLETLNEPLEKVSVDPWIHPNEVDTILRLNQFIESVFKDKNPKVNYHVPRDEYYLYGRFLQSKGSFNREQIDEWITAVDMRANGIQRLIEKRTTKDVQIIKPLAPAEDYIKNADSVSVEGVADRLRGDVVWRNLLEKNRPQSLLDINYLSYIYAYLSTARGSDQNDLANRGQNRLVVAVENPEEARILVQAQENIDAIERPATIVAAYVHPRVLTQHTDGKQYLYFYPNHDGRKVRALKEIYREYR